MLCCQWPEHLLYHEELINLRLSCKKRLPIGKFTHDAPEGPDVNVLAIVRGAEQQLWRAVPACGNIVRQGCVCGHCAGKAEVAQAQGEVRRVDEKIFRFDVAMYDIMSVAVLNGSC